MSNVSLSHLDPALPPPYRSFLSLGIFDRSFPSVIYHVVLELTPPSDRTLGTFRLHREPILHHLDSSRRRPHPERYRRRHCRSGYPRTQGKDKMESLYRHSVVARVHLSDR